MNGAARDAARALVLRHGWNATAYQILNPGMRLWFAHAGNAVAGYAVHGHTWVVAGAPVCAPERLAAAVAELERTARAAGARVIYFGAGTRFEHVTADRPGRQLLLLGAQPVWDPRAWPSIVAHKASLRAQLHRARNKGIAVREWPSDVAQSHPALECVRREWLASRGLPPLHFMTGSDTLADLRDRRAFVAERGDGTIVGFLIATPVPGRQGWLIEQWPRTAGAPNGTTHLLVDGAMRALGTSGTQYVTLGLAPLSEHAGSIGAGQPVWLRGMLRWIRAHGRRFYNFRGLDAFKSSLEPQQWEPVYAVAYGNRITPRMLRAIGGVFSGGSPERLVARALGAALVREIRQMAGTIVEQRATAS